MSFATAGLVGGITSAVGSYMEGETAAAAEESNAALARAESRLVTTSRNLIRKREKRELASYISSQRALSAKSGVLLSGSPLEAMQASAEAGELDIIINDINSRMQADRLQTEASMREASAYSARATGFMRAGTTLLSSAAAYGQRTAPSQRPNLLESEFSRSGSTVR